FEAVKTAALVQPVKVAPYYAILDFGSADEIAAIPAAPDDLPFVKGIQHYVQGVAATHADDLAAARIHADAIAGLRDDAAMEELAADGVPTASILHLSELVLRARIDRRDGVLDAARAKLEEAVKVQ